MPRTSSEYPNGYTLGIEYETEDILPNNVPSAIRSLGFSTTHDASIESEFAMFDGMKLSGPNLLLTRQTSSAQIRGVELVSVPFNMETVAIAPILFRLTKWLTEEGESPQSDRAGIHYHIGMNNVSLGILKRLIKWGRHLEALFFRLGGNGYKFRGMQNDAAFCRPITKFGPPCVPYNRGHAKCFDLDQLLAATTMTEFWLAYGNSDYSNVPRYVPQRYTWLNFYSLLAHGTIEVRVFNKTLNPLFMIAEIDLWQRLVLDSMGIGSIPENEVSVYDNPSDTVLHRQIEYLVGKWDLEPKTTEILHKIVDMTPPVVLDPKPVITHLVETQSVRSPWDSSSFTPVRVSEAHRANVVTIHTLRRETAASPTRRGTSGLTVDDIRNMARTASVREET